MMDRKMLQLGTCHASGS